VVARPMEPCCWTWSAVRLSTCCPNALTSPSPGCYGHIPVDNMSAVEIAAVTIPLARPSEPRKSRRPHRSLIAFTSWSMLVKSWNAV
jgi:hypothetical protein